MDKFHREVEEIRAKMLNNPWPQFLSSVVINGLRGWSGQEIKFNFPVTVLAGENGSGKSTVLKVAASAYANPRDRALTFYPDTFFPDTPWETVSSVILTYKITQGKQDKVYTIRKKSQRWRGFENRPKRNVILQDISRTLPLDATVGYARIARRGLETKDSTFLSDTITKYYASIMGRKYTSIRIAQSEADINKPVGVVLWNNTQFSQFHQGAGEDTTLDLLKLLQDIPEYSLVIIDEVEASLHPRSQRRLIHFLLWLARTKQIQVILSTHSNYILEELPPEARIFLNRLSQNVEVLYGISTNYALNRMDDHNKPDLYIFTEDREATTLLKEILKLGNVDMDRISCIEVGPSDVVESLGRISQKNKLPVPSISVLDGDQTPKDGCICLPGTLAPERQVFQDILSNNEVLESLAKRLDISIHSLRLAFEHATSMIDHHDWIKGSSSELSQTPTYLWETMCQVWVKYCMNLPDVENFLAPIKNRVK